MKVIALRCKGQPKHYTRVDDADYKWLNQSKWHYCDGYARRSVNVAKNTNKIIWMHRAIAGTPEGMQTDHIDGDRLNNQRANLRICKKKLNARNRRIGKNNTTGFKGVFRSSKGKFISRIGHNNKIINLGTFTTARQAANAYKAAAIKYHKDFASYLA